MNEKVQKKLQQLFDSTLEKDLKFEGDLSDMNYYNLICKASANDSLHNIMSNNLCMFKCKYKDHDSVMMIFSVPVNPENNTRHISERVMDVIREVEECFITLDYVNSKEVKEDKFVYITVVKKVNGDNVREE